MSMSAVMVAPMGLAGQVMYHELSLVRLKTFVSLINQHLRRSGCPTNRVGRLGAVAAGASAPRKKASGPWTPPAVPTRFAQALATIVAAAARLAGRFAEAWRHRHDAAVLAALDDTMLADLGPSGAGLNDALPP